MRARLLSITLILLAASSFGAEFRLLGWAVTTESVKVHLRKQDGRVLELTQGLAHLSGVTLLKLNPQESSCVILADGALVTVYVEEGFASSSASLSVADLLSPLAAKFHASLPASQLRPLILEIRELPPDLRARAMEGLAATYGAGNAHASQSSTPLSPDPARNSVPLPTLKQAPTPSNDFAIERTEYIHPDNSSTSLLDRILTSPVPEVGELVGSADEIREINRLKKNLPEGSLRNRIEKQLQGYASPAIHQDD